MNNDISTKELLDTIAGMLNNMKYDLGALLQAEQISNYLAMSTNPLLPENMRKDALNRALSLQGLTNNQEFSEDKLPDDVLGR